VTVVRKWTTPRHYCNADRFSCFRFVFGVLAESTWKMNTWLLWLAAAVLLSRFQQVTSQT